MGKNCGPWIIDYYYNDRGQCPVQDFIMSLPNNQIARARDLIKLLEEFGTNLGSKHARKLKGHNPLWELKPTSNRIIYFAHEGRKMVLLHAFKKTNKKRTKKEIVKAERRRRIILEEENG